MPIGKKVLPLKSYESKIAVIIEKPKKKKNKGHPKSLASSLLHPKREVWMYRTLGLWPNGQICLSFANLP